MIVELSVALAAVAFAVLVIFLILVLIDVRKTLKKVNQTLLFVESRVDPIQDEALELLKNTKHITATLNEQLQAVNPLVNTVYDVGTAIQNAKNELSNELSRKKSYRAIQPDREQREWSERLEDILELGAHALSVWHHEKKRRR